MPLHFDIISVRRRDRLTKKEKGAIKMKEWISNQVELHFTVDGEEKMKKQTISNVIQNASESNLLAYGRLIERLVPEKMNLDSTVLVEKTRYTA